MRGIAKFYTLFWIVYFPTCIAFNELPSMGLVDEVMTVILIGYTFTKINTRYVVKRPRKEYYQFLLILTFFTIYGMLFGANIPDNTNAVAIYVFSFVGSVNRYHAIPVHMAS